MTIAIFAVYGLTIMAAMHILHRLSDRYQLTANDVYGLAFVLGIVALTATNFLTVDGNKVLRTYWPISGGVAIVAVCAYDWLQDRFWRKE